MFALWPSRSFEMASPQMDARGFFAKAPMPMTPTHIVAKPGDRRSLCGLTDPLPVVWVKYVDNHVRGYGMPVCPECAALRNAG